jgi:hypothetical protein
MTTVKEFREALEALIDYCWKEEEDDFIMLMEDEESVLHHIFLSIFTLHNSLLISDGLIATKLKHVLQDRNQGHDMPEYYFLCTNEECGVMNHEVDLIPESLVLSLEEGEKIPAGCCKMCGGTVVSL